MPTFRTTILTLFLVVAMMGCAATIAICEVSATTARDAEAQISLHGMLSEPSSDDMTSFMAGAMALFVVLMTASAVVTFVTAKLSEPRSGWLVSWTLAYFAMLLFIHYDRYQPLGGRVVYAWSSGLSRAGHPTLGVVLEACWGIDVAAAWLLPSINKQKTRLRVLLHIVILSGLLWFVSTLSFDLIYKAVMWALLGIVVTLALSSDPKAAIPGSIG